MELTDEQLRKIEWMGVSGYTHTNVAHELNMTLSELRKERLSNERLNNALKGYEFNMEAIFVDKMMEAAISSNKKLAPEIYVAVFRYLSEKVGY